MAYNHFSGFSDCNCGSGANAITDLALLDTILTYAKSNGSMGQLDLGAALKKLDTNTKISSGRVNGETLEIVDSDGTKHSISLKAIFDAINAAKTGAATETAAGAVKLGNKVLANDGTTVLGRLIGV